VQGTASPNVTQKSIATGGRSEADCPARALTNLLHFEIAGVRCADGTSWRWYSQLTVNMGSGAPAACQIDSTRARNGPGFPYISTWSPTFTIAAVFE